MIRLATVTMSTPRCDNTQYRHKIHSAPDGETRIVNFAYRTARQGNARPAPTTPALDLQTVVPLTGSDHEHWLSRQVFNRRAHDRLPLESLATWPYAQQ